jgi:hypothetical protein
MRHSFRLDLSNYATLWKWRFEALSNSLFSAAIGRFAHISINSEHESGDFGKNDERSKTNEIVIMEAARRCRPERAG